MLGLPLCGPPPQSAWICLFRINLSSVPDQQVRDQVAQLQIYVASAGPTSLPLPHPSGTASPEAPSWKGPGVCVIPETIPDQETQTLASFLAGELLLLKTGSKRLGMRLCG